MPEPNFFFEHPILNSPYERPGRHWELDADGQPTQRIIEQRRRAEFVTPIPKPKTRKDDMGNRQGKIIFNEAYDLVGVINDVREEVSRWSSLPNPGDWGVTPETARLLRHWRQYSFSGIRPFFCQIEAVETAVWLAEVAPKSGKNISDYLARVNEEANPGLLRTALKLATGAGKTAVMAMLIAWQTVNAVRHPQSRRFTKGFLIVTPGITVKDRLRVLLPNDPDSYYRERELVPADMMEDVARAKIVITNYHAFKLRERAISKGGRALLYGRHAGESGASDIDMTSMETEGQMLQRVMPGLVGMKNIFVINDEAHHCYRRKPPKEDGNEDGNEDGEKSGKEKLSGDEKREAEKNNEAARLWISGLEIVKRKLGIANLTDLSATPFFLRGSGYPEGSLFPWTMSDFSLMDAIECGIVKLPRVPVDDNVPGDEMPKFRNLWENIGKYMPKEGRVRSKTLDPLSLPLLLQNALQALYGNYKKVSGQWEEAQREAGREQPQNAVPPCFIIVCNNTSTSKLIYDYISGFRREDGSFKNGKLALFRNFDEYGEPLDRPNTLLIDSEQLESGEGIDEKFREAASDEIERFRRERVERSGDASRRENISDQELLREVMNTVGKPGQLGQTIRCVVSVSMLTEGWDANNVTHVLGVRAFGTQLLCEQVVGRALRRSSYELNGQGLFDVEYADVFGIPFDFTGEPVAAKHPKPVPTIQVRAVSPERDHLEIRFPQVAGYRTELPRENVAANFSDDSVLELTPDLVGPSVTENAGIIGKPEKMGLEPDARYSTLAYELTRHLLNRQLREKGRAGDNSLFWQFRRVVRQWLGECLVCKGGTQPAQLMYLQLADMACERIMAAITRAYMNERPVRAVLDPYNPEGSTARVRFNTSKTLRRRTDPEKCHVNWVILDSGWEGEFCRAAESHPKVFAYVKNHGLGFEAPYQLGGVPKMYRPDFIVLVDGGGAKKEKEKEKGKEKDFLHLIVEIKGYRGEDAKAKKETMETYWVPGVNELSVFGRWAFAELTDAFEIQDAFGKLMDEVCAHG